MPYVFNKNLVSQVVLGALLAVSFLLLVYVVVFPLQAREEARLNAENAREEASTKMRGAFKEQNDLLKKLGMPPGSTGSVEKSDAKAIAKMWEEHIQSGVYTPKRPETIADYAKEIESLLESERKAVSKKDETISGLESDNQALRSKIGEVYATALGQTPPPRDPPSEHLRAISDKIRSLSDAYKQAHLDLEAVIKERDQHKSELKSIDGKYTEQVNLLNGELTRVKKECDAWKEKAKGLEDQVEELKRQAGQEKDKTKSTLIVEEKFEATPDGDIILVRGNGKSLIGAVNIGKNEKARPGMVFEVFRGENKKGRIQIYEVADNISYFRLIELYAENNPIVEGDQIHNPFYRRGVPTEFVVVGEFPSPFSRAKIIDRIQEWGGTVVEKITANTKYVVIGEGTLSEDVREAIQLYGVERISLAGLKEFLGEQ